MKLNLIVATDNRGGIAKDGQIPWKSKKDMRFFKNVTTGNGKDIIDLSSVTDATKGSSTVTTGAGDDIITGTAGKDVINAGDGNDTINATGSADTITLGAGNDTYVLGAATNSVLAKLIFRLIYKKFAISSIVRKVRNSCTSSKVLIGLLLSLRAWSSHAGINIRPIGPCS